MKKSVNLMMELFDILCAPRLLATGLLAAMALSASPASHAQGFPSKSLRLIVPAAPAGPTDILGRLVGAEMAKDLGRPVVVENRAGGDGAIGADAVAKSPPDGHTICFCTTGAVVILPILEPKLPYDVARDFAAVGQVFRAVSVFIARIDLPAANLRQLVAYAKANPGKVTYGTAQSGSPQHIAGETLRSLAGIDILHIPFKGAQPALNELLGGRLDFQVGTVLITDPLYRAGKVKILAVTGPVRWASWPEVPTVIESGFPGFDASDTLVGLHVSAGTPTAIIERLHASLLAALAAPSVTERFANAGVTAVGSRPEVYSAFLVKERERFARIIKQIGAKRD